MYNKPKETNQKHANGFLISRSQAQRGSEIGLALGCTPAELGLKHHVTEVNFI